MAKIFRLFFFFTVFVSLEGCYLLKNAYYLNSLYNSRRKIEEVLSDKRTPPKVRQKLNLALEILNFAKNEGLSTGGKYQDYVEVGERPVSYLVEAAEPDQLKQLTWWFPIVGSVPYLGFFDKQDREKKARELREKGYDIYESEAQAFSGLGWLKDPILSSYLRGSEASLANLLFHELTHATLWVPDQVEFNENLASYVGDVLTIKFLETKNATLELKRYLAKKEDHEKFSAWLKGLRGSLEDLYTQRVNLSQEILLKKKQDIFSLYLGEKRPKFSVADYVGNERWNNAIVLGNSLYVASAEKFSKAHSCIKDSVTMGQFLKKIQEATVKYTNPFQAMDSLCFGVGEGG